MAWGSYATNTWPDLHRATEQIRNMGRAAEDIQREPGADQGQRVILVTIRSSWDPSAKIKR